MTIDVVTVVQSVLKLLRKEIEASARLVAGSRCEPPCPRE